MSQIIIHKNAAGKFNFTVTGNDVNESILATSHGQGYERRIDAKNSLYSVQGALCPPFCMTAVPGWDIEIEYMTHDQYTEWKRKYRNHQARNRRARK